MDQFGQFDYLDNIFADRAGAHFRHPREVP